MAVIKRTRQSSASDLAKALDEFIDLLEGQNEEEAIEELKAVSSIIKSHKADDPAHKSAIVRVIDAFEGDHELMAYTIQREDKSQWTTADQLSMASSRVFSLAKRMSRS